MLNYFLAKCQAKNNKKKAQVMAEKKPEIAKYKFDIFFAVSILFLILIFIIFFRNIHYKSGLEGNAFYALASLPWILLWLGALILFSLTAIISTIMAIIKAFKTKKIEWLRLSLAVLPLLAVVGSFLLNALSAESGPGAWHFLRGYEKWVEKNVDIPAIQKWLISLPSEYSGQDYFEASDFPEELPDVITKLDPYHMYLSKFKDGQRSVEFEWGSALGHFGIVIGLQGMETPEEEELIKHSDSEWEYKRPIQSGVYIFDRG